MDKCKVEVLRKGVHIRQCRRLPPPSLFLLSLSITIPEILSKNLSTRNNIRGSHREILEVRKRKVN
jgi:hypothetical protein